VTPALSRERSPLDQHLPVCLIISVCISFQQGFYFIASNLVSYRGDEFEAPREGFFFAAVLFGKANQKGWC